MFKVSQLYIYPVKSLGGIALDTALVTDRGFKHDRRWMLVDENNRFISQREMAQLALLNVSIEDDGLKITHKHTPAGIIVPFHPVLNETCTVTIWDDSCPAVYVSHNVDKWFTTVLGIICRLVYMPDDSHRRVDEKYTFNNEITSFSDAYPFLLISQASLVDLNARLDTPVPMNRFRPNIVIVGTNAYYEDLLQQFTINNITFNGVKLCSRCVMTTINQLTGEKNKEPLQTLARYRNKGNKILFGQNLVHKGMGTIAVGDVLTDITLHTDDRFMVGV